jgi:hypothetical protein
MPQAGNDVPMGLKKTETASAATAGLMNTRVEKPFFLLVEELTHQWIIAPLIRVEPMSSSDFAEAW